MSSFPIVLSHYQVKPVLLARKAGQQAASMSADLGMNQVQVTLTPTGVQFPDGQRVTWAVLEQIAGAENACFRVLAGEAEKIQRFSPEFNRVYTLYPTPGPPTMLISGIPMHRIKGTDPRKDTLAKIRAVRPVIGKVLDTSTGLGYTAIEAARTAEHVVTIELDPVVLDICRMNPWSAALFDNPKITQVIGDSADVILEFSDDTFSRIIHDPPMFNLAGHLYSAGYYRQLWRVLRPGGRLFHYVGSPDTRSGRSVTQGVMKRLTDAGFARVRKFPQAFGVVAYKK